MRVGFVLGETVRDRNPYHRVYHRLMSASADTDSTLSVAVV